MNGVLDRRKNSPLHRSEESSQSPEAEQDFILRKKIQIKTQALTILSQELEECRLQRDRFKVMAEQLQEDLNRRKQASESKITNVTGRITTETNEYRLPSAHEQAQTTAKINSLEEDNRLLDLLLEAKEENKCLRLQVNTMRHQMKETQADIKALRSRKTDDCKQPISEGTITVEQREELLEQMEKLNVKCVQLKLDLQSVIDEKQELVTERDAFKCKAHRLNYELSQALSASKPVDVDALVNENRYLQERLQQLLEEKELTQQSVQKYKSMLDSKRQKGTIKLGGKSTVGSIMNLKQVEQLLQQGPNIPPQKSAAALTELHSICTALLESLNDKNTALAHQKKVNKMLASRMCELDKLVQSPTSRLLEGYTKADVDIKCDSVSMTSDISEERSESKDTDLQIDERSIDQNTKATQTEESHTEQNRESSDSTSSVIDKTESQSAAGNCPESSCPDSDSPKRYFPISDWTENSEYSDVKCNISAGYKTPRYVSDDSEFNYLEFEKELNEELPEHLKALIQQHLDELYKEEEEKRQRK